MTFFRSFVVIDHRQRLSQCHNVTNVIDLHVQYLKLMKLYTAN